MDEVELSDHDWYLMHDCTYAEPVYQQPDRKTPKLLVHTPIQINCRMTQNLQNND